MKVHIQVKLFFYDVNVIARLGESEVLAGEPFQGILAVGQAVNLTVHILDLGAVPLDQLFLIVDLEAGPDEENGGDANGITNKRAPFSVLPIQITIPDVPELSHCFRTIFVQK